MKPIAPASNLTFPLSLGLAALPLLREAPVWGGALAIGATLWAYAVWRSALERQTPMPEVVGESFAPLDIAIAWRTPSGEFPATRRGWRAVLTDHDLWLAVAGASHRFGADRDYVRIPRLDVVECALASETELRVRFIDTEGRAQDVRLTHVPRASELAKHLGLSEDRGTRIV